MPRDLFPKNINFDLIDGTPVSVDFAPDPNDSDPEWLYTNYFSDWDYENPFQYCGVCGKKLAEFEELTDFDRHTGIRNIAYYIGCTTKGHEKWKKVRKNSQN